MTESIINSRSVDAKRTEHQKLTGQIHDENNKKHIEQDNARKKVKDNINSGRVDMC